MEEARSIRIWWINGTWTCGTIGHLGLRLVRGDGCALSCLSFGKIRDVLSLCAIYLANAVQQEWNTQLWIDTITLRFILAFCGVSF